jgi:hypothetical protein
MHCKHPKSKNFSRFLITSHLTTYVWSIKYRLKFACNLRDKLLNINGSYNIKIQIFLSKPGLYRKEQSRFGAAALSLQPHLSSLSLPLPAMPRAFMVWCGGDCGVPPPGCPSPSACNAGASARPASMAWSYSSFCATISSYRDAF